MIRHYHEDTCVRCQRKVKHFRDSPAAHKCPHGVLCGEGKARHSPKCYKCLCEHPKRDELVPSRNVVVIVLPGGTCEVCAPNSKTPIDAQDREEAQRLAQRWIERHGKGDEQVEFQDYVPDKDKDDPSTVLRISRRIRKLAVALREEAHSIGTLPTRSSPPATLPEQHRDWYAEAAQKSYGADILETVAAKLEVEAEIKLDPNKKCRFCGGKAAICYPRHLEGKSCA